MNIMFNIYMFLNLQLRRIIMWSFPGCTMHSNFKKDCFLPPNHINESPCIWLYLLALIWRINQKSALVIDYYKLILRPWWMAATKILGAGCLLPKDSWWSIRVGEILITIIFWPMTSPIVKFQLLFIHY